MSRVLVEPLKSPSTFWAHDDAVVAEAPAPASSRPAGLALPSGRRVRHVAVAIAVAVILAVVVGWAILSHSQFADTP